MDWRLVLAILCLIGASACVDALSNQTTTNTTSTQSTTPNTSTENTTLAPTTTNISTTNTTSAPSTATNSSTTNTTSAPSTTTNSSTTNTTSAPNTTTNSSTTNTTSATSTTTNSSTTNTTSAPSTTTNSSTTNITSAPSTTTNSSTTNTTSAQSTTTNSSTTNITSAPSTTTNSSTTNTTSAQSTTTNSSTTNITSAPSTTTNSSTSANTPLKTTRTSSLTSTPVVAAVFNLVFSISETFDPALANTSSPQFVAKATSIRNELEPIYRAAYTNFLQMIIVGFRNGSIVIDSRLEFSDNGTALNNSTVQNTLVNVTTTNTSLKIDLNSINVTQAPATSTTTKSPTINTTSTSSTTTTNTPPAPQNASAIFSLIFSINETFDPALANTSSTQFVAKATSIRNQVEPLYKKAFKNFILMRILKFTNGSTVTESNLYMDSSGPNATLSQVRDIFLNGLDSLNFSVDPKTVNATMIPVTNTSSPNTTSTLSTTTNSPTTTNTSSTFSTITTATNTPPIPQNATAIFSLIFSINETFDPALANTSSPLFLAKATSIRNQVEPLYKKAFKNFILMRILKFRSGSTVTESNLYMDSSGPNATLSQVRETFLSGLDSLDFSVDPKSVSINMIPGNSMPPVIDSSLSMIWMSLLSLLVSVTLHF